VGLLIRKLIRLALVLKAPEVNGEITTKSIAINVMAPNNHVNQPIEVHKLIIIVERTKILNASCIGKLITIFIIFWD